MNFTSILDKNYISRLKVLLNSLMKFNSEFNFYVVALDDLTYETFLNQINCISIKIEDVHKLYPELDIIKIERDYVSYLFTLSPYYPSYILEVFPELDHICSLDVDQYFFSSPRPIFDLLINYSVLITPHRFSSNVLIENPSYFGDYNVSFQVFKRDSVGMSCLKFWRKQCLNWCYDRLEGELYADQKYLNYWSNEFGEKIYSIENKGLGLAPWNLDQFELSKKNGKIFVNEDELILFHYQGLKFLEYGYIYTYLDHYSDKSTEHINKFVYKVVIKKLLKHSNQRDVFNRNKNFFDLNFLLVRSNYVFKYKYGMLFTLKRFLSFKLK